MREKRQYGCWNVLFYFEKNNSNCTQLEIDNFEIQNFSTKELAEKFAKEHKENLGNISNKRVVFTIYEK